MPQSLAVYTLAFLIGMPVGSVLGDMFGWQAAFWFACAICLVALVILALAAPARIQAPDMGAQSFASALRGDNALLMCITMLAFCATFATVSFIGPVITKASGLTGAAIGAVQVSTGVGSILGLALGAWLAKLPPRRGLAILVATTAFTQMLFALIMLNDLGSMALCNTGAGDDGRFGGTVCDLSDHPVQPCQGGRPGCDDCFRAQRFDALFRPRTGCRAGGLGHGAIRPRLGRVGWDNRCPAALAMIAGLGRRAT